MLPRTRLGGDERERAAPAVRNDALARRAEELAAQGAAFATATVVRAQRPTSAHAGDVALITSDGNIEGFVGGICAEHSVRLFAWTAMKSGEPMLLRILPTEEEVAAHQDAQQDGAVTVLNSCLSGGAIEIFLEPTLPTPRVNIVGSKPIAAALEQLGPAVRPGHRRRRRQPRAAARGRPRHRRRRPRQGRAGGPARRPRGRAALRRARRQPQARQGAARGAARGRRARGAARARRLPRRHRHRRPHPARGGAHDPRAPHRGALRRHVLRAAALAERRAAPRPSPSTRSAA